MNVSLQVPKFVRWDFARETANKLTEKYSSPPIPVVEIAEGNGIAVHFSDFGKHSANIAGFCDFEEPAIYVNNSDSFGRKMFTIAHELGHWMLHRDFFEANPKEYAVLPRFQKAVKNIFEREANCFAAELLVPKGLLLPIKDAGVARLADLFGVSREAMENRLKNV
jgi:Zn-dependent peptidase ImmA (M78 family)